MKNKSLFSFKTKNRNFPLAIAPVYEQQHPDHFPIVVFFLFAGIIGNGYRSAPNYQFYQTTIPGT